MSAFQVTVTEAPVSKPSPSQAMMQGAYDYLVKPFDIGRVRALVDAAFKQRPLTRSSIRLGGQEGEDEPASDQMVGKSAAVLEVYKKIGQVADVNLSCLIRKPCGETAATSVRPRGCSSFLA